MNEAQDRRRAERERASALKQQLNDAQLATLNTLERFGWEVKFIRRAPEGKVTVLYDPDVRKYAILGEDGVLDEAPRIAFR